MKEAKAVFLYDWIKKVNNLFVYERVKDYLLTQFQEIIYTHANIYSKSTYIIKEGEESKHIMIIKEGTFAISKNIGTQSSKNSKISILTFRIFKLTSREKATYYNDFGTRKYSWRRWILIQ